MINKKRFGGPIGGVILLSTLVLLILAIAVYGATRPSQGGSNNVWGDELNTWLDVAHESGGNIKENYVTSGMIVNGTIGEGDLAGNSVKGSHIQTLTALNVTSLALTGGSSVNSSSNYTATTVTGMFVHTAQLDLPSISVGTCVIANITMLGLPANSLCIPVMGEIFATGTATGAAASPLGGFNITVTGMNSSINFCRLAVCGVNATINPPVLTYTVLAVTV